MMTGQVEPLKDLCNVSEPYVFVGQPVTSVPMHYAGTTFRNVLESMLEARGQKWCPVFGKDQRSFHFEEEQVSDRNFALPGSGTEDTRASLGQVSGGLAGSRTCVFLAAL